MLIAANGVPCYPIQEVKRDGLMQLTLAAIGGLLVLAIFLKLSGIKEFRVRWFSENEKPPKQLSE
jgi:uncharacterized membrane protein YqgA involved in biofilm formation